MTAFSSLMVAKGVVTKNFEAMRMVRALIGERIPANGTVKLSQYQKMFSKAFLRGALMNVFYYLKKVAKREGATRVAADPADKAEAAREIAKREEDELQNGLLHVLKY